ncbi:MAG: D-aminoacylase [Eubacteriales bacterium]|nr:D-aminoacylase [Eubacteriales bacterium]
MTYDLLIRGGTVVDGTGSAAYGADVAVKDSKIAAIGNLDDVQAKRTIDADGYLVTPGFIDIHRHADAAVFRPHFGDLELSQGLTTIVNGNCGLSVAPFGEENKAAILSYLRPITGTVPTDICTDSMAGYLNQLHDLPIHVGMLVGAGILRADAAGYQVEHLEKKHYDAIRASLEQALAEGALGVSLGLGYAPECFYTTDELMEALRPLAGKNIPVTVHMRQEGGGVCEALEEMLTVAKTLDIPVHISHLKAMGKVNWGKKIPRALQMLQDARAEGLNVSCDVYPYTAGSTQLLHILPPDFLAGGLDAVTERLKDAAVRQKLAERIESGEGFDNIAGLAGWDGIYLTSLHREENRIYQGKNLAEIGAMMGKTPLDACCDLLVSEHCEITMIDFMASEDDIAAILCDEWSNLISDATYPTEGQPHPRVYGTFTHLLTHFVHEKGVLGVEEAVHKMTQRPAQVLQMERKGVLAVGMDADINVFALQELHEPGTYENPCQLAQGMQYVIVGGAVALANGQITGIKAGKVIRR